MRKYEKDKKPLQQKRWYLPQRIRVKYPLIGKWFDEECIPEYKSRRKLLVLFSEKRELGKTLFAKNLTQEGEHLEMPFPERVLHVMGGTSPDIA